MSRITDRFSELRARGETGLVIYIMAGDPDLETTRRLIPALERAGADVIELGVPFTDPLADGPSIQAANERALASGTTLGDILGLVRDVRQETQIPILLMTYYNPIFRAGQEQVARAARDAGVDGMLITDLPPEEAADWKQAAADAGLDTIFLLAPTSTEERIRIAAENASGFVYCVSRTGVTGVRQELPEDLHTLLDRIRARTDQPIAVGFGVSTPEHVRQIGQWCDAAVVGSAVVNLIAREGRDSVASVARFVRELKAGPVA
ncbi:MAG TPA: tryptophan synthase subunit alpha [Armatimonadota bacterium]|nr:tryptophan synthase subunit alpha [Armatimonadota bacterium]